MTNHGPIIQVESLEKTFYPSGGANPIPVLHGVNLEIDSTDFCIIYGPSGCGKSTLLHHIVGLEDPTSGKVIVRGTDLTTLRSEEKAAFRAKKFGMVYQLWFWVKSLTVWENVALPLLIAGEREADAKIKALRALDEIKMADYADKKPMQLSGG